MTANATWSGRHFSQMPAEPSLGRREKKKGEKWKSRSAASRDQCAANAQDLPSKLWQDIARRPFPMEQPGLGEGGWDKEQVPK